MFITLNFLISQYMNAYLRCLKLPIDKRETNIIIQLKIYLLLFQI